MCWDISLATDVESIRKHFPKLNDKRDTKDYDFSWLENVQAITFPEYPIIFKEIDSCNLGLINMEWGVLPTYIQDSKEQEERSRNMINVRSERILEDKSSYWHRLRNQRCLIPVTGIYEHRKIKGWSKKVPYHIGEESRDMFYIPGIYQWHESFDINGNPKQVGSFGMLTRSANNLMSMIHNDGPNKHRMPLFLPEVLEQFWLGELTDEEIGQVVSYEIPDDMLTAHPVYTLRGYPERPDGKHRYEPYDWNELPPLGHDSLNILSLF